MTADPNPTTPPGTAQRRRVFVRNLVVPWSIGVYAHERNATQRVRINVELDVDPDAAPEDDDIRNVVSYENIVDSVQELAATGHINLVETLAERIGELCLVDSRVATAVITVEKLDVYDLAESVGIEVEYSRQTT